MSRIYFKSSNESKFEILKGSHVALKQAKGKWYYWDWDEIPTIQGELNQILAEGEEMLERVNKLIKSHPDIAVSY
jgi:hypothetical protein